jgi:hypothetical protein
MYSRAPACSGWGSGCSCPLPSWLFWCSPWLARISKDCAAAAVLVAAVASLIIAALVVVPPLITRLGL